jgi:hypothetical protein
VSADVDGASNPTGNVLFVVNPGSGSPLIFTSPIVYVAPSSPVTATATILGSQFLAPGSHVVHMSYLGDVNYAASTSPVVFNYLFRRTTPSSRSRRRQLRPTWAKTRLSR